MRMANVRDEATRAHELSTGTTVPSFSHGQAQKEIVHEQEFEESIIESKNESNRIEDEFGEIPIQIPEDFGKNPR